MLKDLKIELSSHAQFLEAWGALMKLGYHWGGNCPEPRTAPYLYAYEDGRILADYFDVEGADLSSPNSAKGYFNAHEHKEISLAELVDLAQKVVSPKIYAMKASRKGSKCNGRFKAADIHDATRQANEYLSNWGVGWVVQITELKSQTLAMKKWEADHA